MYTQDRKFTKKQIALMVFLALSAIGVIVLGFMTMPGMYFNLERDPE